MLNLIRFLFEPCILKQRQLIGESIRFLKFKGREFNSVYPGAECFQGTLTCTTNRGSVAAGASGKKLYVMHLLHTIDIFLHNEYK